MNDRADSCGRKNSLPKFFSMMLPIMTCLSLPSSSALTKSPVAGMKVSSVPANTPGSDSRRVILRNARCGLP